MAMSTARVAFWTLAPLVAFLAAAGCQSGGARAGGPDAAASEELIVVMTTSVGDITLALDPVHAPISTGNFLNHAAKGHYAGTVFHRVVPKFVIQGGGWNPDMTDRSKAAKAAGTPDEPIVNEWATSGLKNLRGTIAWARDADPDTATREFYINLADNAKLDTARETTGRAGYAVFGRVIAGMDVVDKIAAGRTMERPDLVPEEGGMKDVPVEPVTVLAVKRK